ncbi:MAG: ABC transporter ATP-binding protein [Alphaproteobacteria bacterium]
MMEPLLSFDGVGKTFANGVEALAGIDLAVPAGAFISLIGASGSGKSTLLRLAAGLAAPTTGQIRWQAGADMKRPGRIGFVFQEPTLMPWATVWANVHLPLRIARLPRVQAAARVDEALALVGLADWKSAHPHQLSGGMRMRVSIARALVTDPAILLLDEPFAALDELTRFRLDEDLRRLWQHRRLTVLFVTHSVAEATWLAERVIVLAQRPGRISADIPVTLPEPRDRTTQASATFAGLIGRVSDALAGSLGSQNAI